MKTIICANGETAMVDDDMYEVLSQYRWKVNRGGYAYANLPTMPEFCERTTKVAMMAHCVIGRSVFELVTDHMNGTKLDNRRSNLRHATHQQNVLNRRNCKDGLAKSFAAPSAHLAWRDTRPIDAKTPKWFARLLALGYTLGPEPTPKQMRDGMEHLIE